MLDSLRSLALAVSASRPVLVQGPVGCGKTSLVQHIASMTGRHASPHVIKVQLGDQTDSKVCLICGHLNDIVFNDHSPKCFKVQVKAFVNVSCKKHSL